MPPNVESSILVWLVISILCSVQCPSDTITNTEIGYTMSLGEKQCSTSRLDGNIIINDYREQKEIIRSRISYLKDVQSDRLDRIVNPIPFQLISEGVKIVDADRAHHYNVTGQNVRVAIIDVGFNINSEEITDNVAEFRAFTGDGLISVNPSHGTAVAEILVDTAPDVELYLYQIDGPLTFMRALDRAIENDVRIISISIGFINLGPYDGTSLTSIALDEVRRLGILPVVSSGNFAKNHWGGTFRDTDGDGIHEFTSDAETNSINASRGDLIQIALGWNDWPLSSIDYDVFLLDSRSRVVASSSNKQDGSISPAENIRHLVHNAGEYSIEIRSNGIGVKDVRLDLFTSQNLEHFVSEGSIGILADSKGSLTVGASSLDDGVEPFSSRGPTWDGRVKPDVVAPNMVTVDALSGPFRGTSPSAPYVAGIAALLLNINPLLSADDLQYLIEGSALDIGEKGRDNLSGAGRAELKFLLLDAESRVAEISLDGVLLGTGNLPEPIVWPIGSSHTISIQPEIVMDGGQRSVFDLWNDGVISSSRVIIYDVAIESLIASFTTEYLLTITSQFKDVSGGGWYQAGSEVTLSIPSMIDYGNGSRLRFTGWSGDIRSTEAEILVTMGSPIRVSVDWEIQYLVEVKGNGGEVDGEGWYNKGSIASIRATNPSAVSLGMSRLIFNTWSGDIMSDVEVVDLEVDAPHSIDANWTTQYFLTVKSQFGEPSGEGWYNSGDLSTFSVQPSIGFIIRDVFHSWSGDSTSSEAEASIIMDSPKIVMAIWAPDYIRLLILGIIIITSLIIILKRQAYFSTTS